MILFNFINNCEYTQNLKSDYEIINNLQDLEINPYNINYAYFLEENLRDIDNVPYHDSIVSIVLIIFFLCLKFLLNLYP